MHIIKVIFLLNLMGMKFFIDLKGARPYIKGGSKKDFRGLNEIIKMLESLKNNNPTAKIYLSLDTSGIEDRRDVERFIKYVEEMKPGLISEDQSGFRRF
jgi:hypothetical protein